MSSDSYPFIPPRDLVQQWRKQWHKTTSILFEDYIAANAARWGANKELEACCEYMQHEDFHGYAVELRAARRPKPPSLKEQAKQAWLRFMDVNGHDSAEQKADDFDIIRRALNALPYD